MAIANYRANAWYWTVGGSVYSSKDVAYVPANNTAYTAWRADGNRPTPIATEQELADVLIAAGVGVPNTWVESDAAKDRRINNMDRVSLRIAFRQENLIRQLIRALRASSTAANTAATNAGLPTAANSADLTVAQFLIAIRSML